MDAWVFEVSRNTGPDNIARPKLMRKLLRFRLGSWEAMLIHQAELPTPMPSGADEQWHDPFDSKMLRRTLADTGGVTPMRFRQASPGAIELGQPRYGELFGDRRAPS